ncbi:flavin reductase family protein [Ancylobacter sp. Lp-2]|uniref:flavin reductase family protein n=1 Tax=Ancylobacter sp. Lp-2 TaxID=2881339 RepID=UPI001E376A78|nr:flavin reductase family protein [Ancylobacter sp. Lp-2]MCB4771747.1 flavin reductase family protein [Ancylobacter sp. Lp-2]
MFYAPDDRDRTLLPHNPLKAIVAPRPIGWISSLSPAGVANLAPYSFFNLVSESPDIVMFSSTGVKDTVRNILDTGEFVCNLASRELLAQVNLTSAALPREESEFDLAGLETAPSRLVKPPRVAAAPCALECALVEVRELAGRSGAPTGHWLVFGEIVGIHIDEAFVEGGVLRIEKLNSLARCGYFDYAAVEEIHTLPRPGGQSFTSA